MKNDKYKFYIMKDQNIIKEISNKLYKMANKKVLIIVPTIDYIHHIRNSIMDILCDKLSVKKNTKDKIHFENELLIRFITSGRHIDRSLRGCSFDHCFIFEYFSIPPEIRDMILIHLNLCINESIYIFETVEHIKGGISNEYE